MATIKFQDVPHTNLLASLPLSSLNEIYSCLLQDAVDKNDSSSKTGIGTRGPITRFHSRSPPPLTIRDYLNRLTKFTPFPRDALLLSSIYLNRISHLSISTAYSYSISGSLDTFRDDPIPPKDPSKKPTTLFPNFIPQTPEPVVLFSPLVLKPIQEGGSKSSRSFSNSSTERFSLSSSPSSPPPPPPPPLPISPSLSPLLPPSAKLTRPAPLLNVFTLHRLLLSTLLISTKFIVDGTLSQSRVSKVGGVSTTELVRLEIESLRLLSWSLFVEKIELEGVLKEWVLKGRELGLIPTKEGEVVVEVEKDIEKDRDKLLLPPSPPLKPESSGEEELEDQTLQIPTTTTMTTTIIPLHQTISSSSSSSSSASSTTTTTTNTETSSTSVSSLQLSPTTTSSTSRDMNNPSSHLNEEEEREGEGENTPTKAMKRIDLTTEDLR